MAATAGCYDVAPVKRHGGVSVGIEQVVVVVHRVAAPHVSLSLTGTRPHALTDGVSQPIEHLLKAVPARPPQVRHVMRLPSVMLTLLLVLWAAPTRFVIVADVKAQRIATLRGQTVRHVVPLEAATNAQGGPLPHG